MSEIFSELPDDIRELIEAPLLPITEIEPYSGEAGVLELDEIQENGYKKVLLYQAANDLVFSRVVRQTGVDDESAFEIVEASNDKAVEGSVHPFPIADTGDVSKIFPRAA